MAPHPPPRLALALIAALAAAALGLVTASAADHEPSSAKPASKLSGPLVVLLEAFEYAPAAPADYAAALAEPSSPSAAYLAAGIVRVTGTGVQTYIHVAATDDPLRTALTALGVVIERESEDGGIVQAHVPLSVLAQVADVAGVQSVTPPVYGFSNAGSALTAGDAILSFDDLRAAQGVDGSGVTVGVISDGIAGLATAVASGDLPATSETRPGGTLTATGGGVISTSFRADGDLEAGLSGGAGAEGTAILEIVHDIAPGAQLLFANFETSLEFMDAVDFLASVSDVVIDDIGFFGAPTDQSSDISTNTADALTDLGNPIRAYVTSVGNRAEDHYEETYVDSGADGFPLLGVPGGLHLFGPTSATTDCLDVGDDTANFVFLKPGKPTEIWLTWDDTFGSATTNYDLFLRKFPAGPIVDFSVDNNLITGDPLEFVTFTNSGATTEVYDIFIVNFGDSSPAKKLELFVRGGIPCSNGTTMRYNTVAGSVPAQSDAGGGVLSVGAISAFDLGNDTIEPFSSQGPAGNGALKPDVTAIDGVAVTGAAGFPSTFFGTSAAAPHVAALAALLLQMRPDLLSDEAGDDPAADRAALRAAITGTALDLGTAGADNTFGHGRVDGASAGVALQVAPIVSASADFAVPEGATVSLDVAFSDLNVLETHTASIGWGDGATATGTVDQGLDTVGGSHVYADEGVFTVTVTVTDAAALTDADSFDVTVSNVDPVVDAGPDVFLLLGATLSLDATFTDPGSGDTHVASIDWGDGTVATGTLDQGLGTVSGSHTYVEDDLFTVTVTVTDDDGGVGSDTLTVEVQDDPVVEAGAAQAATEGSTVELSATFVDSASDTHTASIDWGDGSLATGTVDQALDTVGGSHVYADDGVFTVTVTVTDAAALSDFDSFDVTVGNVAPTVTASADTSVTSEDTLTLQVASFTDPGTGDTHTATIDWGDGTVATGTVDQDLHTVEGTHVYESSFFGIIRTVTVTVFDDDGGSSSDTLTVTVLPLPVVPGTTTWGLVALAALLAGAALVSRLRLHRQPAGVS